MFVKKSLAAAALAVALVVTPLAGVTTSYAADPEPAADTTPAATTTIGDVDADGYADLLATDANGDLLLYKGNDKGTFTKGNKLYGGWTTINWASKIPDVNNDGFADILVRRSDDNSLRVYFSDGAASKFRYGGFVGQNWGDLKLLTVVPGDVSGDSTPDIVAVTTKGALLRYSYSDKGFTDQTQIGQNWNGIQGLAGVTTANGFELVGVAANQDMINYTFDTDQSSSKYGLLVDQKTVGKVLKGTDAKGIPQLGGFARIFSAGDINKDGKGDLVSRRADGIMITYLQQEDGSWGDPIRVGGGWDKITLVF